MHTVMIQSKPYTLIPHCPGSAGSPPMSESPHHSSAARWAECCQQHLQIHTGGGQKQPLCDHNVSEEAEGNPSVNVQSEYVST